MLVLRGILIGFLPLLAVALWLAYTDGMRGFGVPIIRLERLLAITKVVFGIGLGMFVPAYAAFYLIMRRH